VLLLTGVGALALINQLTGEIVAIVYGSVSFMVFCMYWLDKFAAERDIRCAPESTLQLLALVGGWPGSSAGQ
jgi:uncharacterized membrane protein YsdA (DUF1294 family)